MAASRYFSNVGGLPPQTQTLSSNAVFTNAYAVIPKTVMSDIVTSVLPHWQKTRAVSDYVTIYGHYSGGQMSSISVAEAKAGFAGLVDEAAKGEFVTITRLGKPAAVIVSVEAA